MLPTMQEIVLSVDRVKEMNMRLVLDERCRFVSGTRRWLVISGIYVSISHKLGGSDGVRRM